MPCERPRKRSPGTTLRGISYTANPIRFKYFYAQFDTVLLMWIFPFRKCLRTRLQILNESQRNNTRQIKIRRPYAKRNWYNSRPLVYFWRFNNLKVSCVVSITFCKSGRFFRCFSAVIGVVIRSTFHATHRVMTTVTYTSIHLTTMTLGRAERPNWIF